MAVYPVSGIGIY